MLVGVSYHILSEMYMTHVVTYYISAFQDVKFRQYSSMLVFLG